MFREIKNEDIIQSAIIKMIPFTISIIRRCLFAFRLFFIISTSVQKPGYLFIAPFPMESVYEKFFAEYSSSREIESDMEIKKEESLGK